jgi:hypothetical protein
VAGVFDTVRYTHRLRPGRIAQAALLAEWDRCRQDNLGYWYASFVVTRVTAAAPGPALPGIGVDWGVKITATTTNPARIAKKAARQNTHDARVWAKNLVDHHALIAVEDFKPILATAERDRASADDVRHQIASFRDGGSGAV